MANHLVPERYELRILEEPFVTLQMSGIHYSTFHFVSDEVYPAVPWSLCLHGPHGCD